MTTIDVTEDENVARKSAGEFFVEEADQSILDEQSKALDSVSMLLSGQDSTNIATDQNSEVITFEMI